MALLLGCIADDFTGATDLASMLVRNGMRTVQLIGVPDEAAGAGEVDAIVVALKSRTIPPKDAVEQSLQALAWLRSRGARQFLFKYCSTIDSTDQGNIGPVTEALMDALDADFTIACPALPENGRSIYMGHLFLGDTLLAESHMRHHPLTPMTDSNLVRVLQRQSKATRVGLLDYLTIEQGAAAVRSRIEALRRDGVRQAIADAVSDRHLLTVGEAAADLALLTGGSGIAMGLPENFRAAGLLAAGLEADALPNVDGHEAVLAGSCSKATLEQIERFEATCPGHAIDPFALGRGDDEVGRALDFADRHLGRPFLISSSRPPEEVERVQAELGRERAGTLVEEAMATIARGLVERGVRRLVVAGGETSGAVVGALGIEALRIGPPIDPGVPWTLGSGRNELLLALKSGNFGAPDFFTKAFEALR